MIVKPNVRPVIRYTHFGVYLGATGCLAEGRSQLHASSRAPCRFVARPPGYQPQAFKFGRGRFLNYSFRLFLRPAEEACYPQPGGRALGLSMREFVS